MRRIAVNIAHDRESTANYERNDAMTAITGVFIATSLLWGRSLPIVNARDRS
jgi:hypothetical protein